MQPLAVVVPAKLNTNPVLKNFFDTLRCAD